MKTLLLALVILAAPLVSCPAQAAQIATQFSDGSRVNGFHESFNSSQAPKLCFTGDSAKICGDIKSSIQKFNQSLASEGAEARVQVKACAQSVKLAMLIYAVKPLDSDASSTVKKTVYVKECK